MIATGSVAVLGSINVDVVLSVARFPRAGETTVATAFARHAGGKGANQAVAAARAGAAVVLTGAVGDDADGWMLRDALALDGVDCTRVVTIPGVPTGNAYVLVDARGENQIVVSGGANLAIDANDVAGTGTVLLTQLETPVDVVARFLRAASAGAITILNAAPHRTPARALFAHADIVVVNETELADYAGGGPDVATAARALLVRPGQTVIVTLGGAGVLLVDRDTVTPFPGRRVPVVDTTGAGDCFCGYLAAGLAAGRPLADAVETAQHAAALCVGRPGAIPSIPYRAELERG